MSCDDQRDPVLVASALERIGFVSRTALLVAHDRALETERQDALIHDPWARLLAGKVGKEMSAGMAQHPFPCNLDADGKPGAWPVYHQHWTAVRTCFIDEVLGVERQAGVEQIVSLGSGLDMRAFRLDCLKGGLIIEVETPEMHEARQTLLDGLGAEPLCKRSAVCCDVTDDALAGKLADGGWDSARPTVWLLEGLLMYLPRSNQEALLQLLGKLSAPGSTAICNFLIAPDHGQFAKAEAVTFLCDAGFDGSIEAVSFGEPGLSFGRYREGVKPDEAFTFVVARKAQKAT